MNIEEDYLDKIKEKGQLIIISGPSAVGKRTVIKEYLRTHPHATKCTSVTTRSPREGEVDGREYYFLTQEEFESVIHAQEMLEYTYYNRNGYGTPKRAVEAAKKAGKDVILNLDVEGAMKVRALCPDATLIFLIPPTWKALEERMKKSNIKDSEVISKRLLIAQEEILCAPQYDYVLINFEIGQTVHRLEQIIHGNRFSRKCMKDFLNGYIEKELVVDSDFVKEVLSL